ncbi:MAG: HlyD family secretion protein [bacterium]
MKEFNIRGDSEVDFSRIDIPDSPPPRKLRHVLLFTVVSVAGFLAYNFFNRLQTVNCRAVVQAELRYIFPLVQGNLKKVDFEPGDSFKKGALLVELDTRPLVSELSFLKRKTGILKAAIETKRQKIKEINGIRRLNRNWKRKDREKKLQAELFQLELSEKETSQKIAEYTGELAGLAEQAGHFQRLIKLKAATNRETRRLEKERQSVQNRLAYWKQRQVKLGERKAELSSVSLIPVPQIETKTTEVSLLRLKLSDFNRRIEELTEKIKKAGLRAPCDGIVVKLHKKEGEELKNNEPVLSYYQRSGVWLEAYTRPSDIAGVKVGSMVDLIDAGGRLIPRAGLVSRIMPVLTPLPPELGNRNNDNYYQIRISLIDSKVPSVFLSPGLVMEVSISQDRSFPKPELLAWL